MAALLIFWKLTLLLFVAESWVVMMVCVGVADGTTKADVEVAKRRAMRVVNLYMLELID